MPEIPSPVLKRPRLPVEVRTQRLAAQVQEPNPLIPLIMHTIERGLQGNARQGVSDVDQVFDRAMAHRNVSRETLQKIVNNYRALPEPIKSRIVAPIAPKPTDAINRRAAADRISKYFIDQLQKPPAPPKITGFAPPSEYGYKPGQIIKLVGAGFSATPANNKVILSWRAQIGIDQPEEEKDYATLTPLKATVNELEIQLPKKFGEGGIAGVNYIRVETTKMFLAGISKKLVSAAVLFKPYTKPSQPPKILVLARPEIDKISPEKQFPGRRVLIEGKNIGAALILKGEGQGTFIDSGKTFSVELVPELNDKAVVKLPAKVLVKSSSSGNGQLEILLPKTLKPDNYWLRLVASSHGLDQIGSSVVKNFEGEVFEGFNFVCKSIAKQFEVSAFSYKVTFQTLHCIDESDPESTLFVNDHDEIVTYWGINADGISWSKQTGEYGGFDDGTTQSYKPDDASIFKIDGSFGEVKIGLAIATVLYEWDEGDVKAAQGALGLVQDIGNELGKVDNPTVALIGKIVGWVAEAASLIVSWLDDGPDHLGQRDLSWSTLDLQTQTDNPQRSFSGQLQFLNGDDDGSYSVTYKVDRFQE